MKTYLRSEEKQALAHALAGGQALHLRDSTALLYDHQLTRLVETVRQFGMVTIFVNRTGTERQHIVVDHLTLMKIFASTQIEHRSTPPLEVAS